MNIGIPNLSAAQAQQGAARSTPPADTKAKISATGETNPELPSVQPGLVAALREAALKEPAVRPEMIEKGSAFLLDPNYPPLDSVNGIASLIIDDFFLNKTDSTLP